MTDDPRAEFLNYAVRRLDQAKDHLASLDTPGMHFDPSEPDKLRAEIALLEQYVALATPEPEKPFTRDDFMRDLRKVAKPEN